MSRGFFVTGTDTGVGKTCVSLGLVRALQSKGLSVAGMKPVASGCRSLVSGLVNEDAEQLQKLASFHAPYCQVNPYAFEPAVAPHLAAAACGARIEISVIEENYRHLSSAADAVVVEGVGGWMVPINDRQTMADVAVALGLPVILVVAIRLGCLNHALLTAKAVTDTGLTLAGWIANRLDPDCQWQEANINALRSRLAAPLLADLDYRPDGFRLEGAAAQIDPGVLGASSGFA